MKSSKRIQGTCEYCEYCQKKLKSLKVDLICRAVLWHYTKGWSNCNNCGPNNCDPTLIMIQTIVNCSLPIGSTFFCSVVCSVENNTVQVSTVMQCMFALWVWIVHYCVHHSECELYIICQFIVGLTVTGVSHSVMSIYPPSCRWINLLQDDTNIIANKALRNKSEPFLTFCQIYCWKTRRGDEGTSWCIHPPDIVEIR